MKHDIDKISAKDTQYNESAADELLDDVGDISIADEVISIVASLAAQEVPGVISMSGGLTDDINRFLGKENAYKGVRLKFTGKTVIANVYVNVEYGCCIPEVALEIQEKVKDAIESMTGYDVQFVDVNVEGVAKRKTTVLEKEVTADEAMADILQAQKQSAIANEVNSFEKQLDNLSENLPLALPNEEELSERQKKFLEED